METKTKKRWAVNIYNLILKELPQTIARVDSFKKAVRIAKSFERQSGLSSYFFMRPLGYVLENGKRVDSRALLKDGEEVVIILIEKDERSSSFENELLKIKKYIL